MSDINCSLIKDLMPLYIDGLTSNDTNEYIKKHLSECSECNSLFEDIKLEPDINLEINNEELNRNYLQKCEEQRILSEKYFIEAKRAEELEVERKSLKEQNNILQQKNDLLNNELVEERQNIDRILKSTSWKISSPIRKIKNLINKFR
jgi:predicted anti-sigma-YlaC factor YlaD